jgi:hypothetical protein
MANAERVTVTLPANLVRYIDRREKSQPLHRGGVRRELDRQRREELHRSLENPHPENHECAEEGFQERAHGLPDEDAESLVDTSAGKAVAWVPGSGWVEDRG